MEEIKEMPEEEDMECLEEPELENEDSMNDDEEDPDWCCQHEERGGDDIDADDEEKESPSTNNIRQVLMICYWQSLHMTTLIFFS